jgi:hypothetical protein
MNYKLPDYQLPMMKRLFLKYLLFFICVGILIAPGCNCSTDGKSDEERFRECEDSCAKITHLNSLSFRFIEYQYGEEDKDTVYVAEIIPGKNDTVIDTIIAKYKYAPFLEKKRQEIYTLEKQIPLKNQYLIIIGTERHLLRNFKFEPSAECGMTSCNFVPALQEWEIDGVIYRGYDFVTIGREQ